MSTPVKERMRTAAAAYSALAALLGSSPFRWYDSILNQGSSFPAVVVTQVSGNETYAFTGRLPTGWSRFSFLIWGGYDASGVTAKEAVASALMNFLDQWNGGTGIAGNVQYPNQVVLTRDMRYTQAKQPIYQKLIDVAIFSNSTL